MIIHWINAPPVLFYIDYFTAACTGITAKQFQVFVKCFAFQNINKAAYMGQI
jgi:hypothetical protein